jgi:transposase
MKRTAKYVGLDVHQATTVVSVRDTSGRVIARDVVATDEASLISVLGQMRGSVAVALEEGTQAQWLHDVLEPVADRVVVCDRRGKNKRGNKGDQVDADELSRLLREGSLRPVYHDSTQGASLRELARAYQTVVIDTTRVMQRIKALFRARGIKTPGMKVYRPAHRAHWLAKLPEGGARFRAEVLYTQLDLLQQLRPKAKTRMIREARRHDAWQVLNTVPQFGEVRVAQLLAILRTPWRFRSKRSLWAYAGLAVTTSTSTSSSAAGPCGAAGPRSPAASTATIIPS